ncbi:MAG: hypothetical protein D6722_20025 [Bacteroidetes bacterium]|nr:MAG: hypothetical protein D6722_20025 [Bacteroidota bacterium]
MSVLEAFDPIAEELAGLAPEKVAMLQAPPGMALRVEELVQKKKEGSLSFEESIELERYLALDLLISLAKARALTMLAS